MDDTRTWTAGIVVIGDEILSGRTQDRNISQIGQWLNRQGIRLKEVRVVADDMGAIAEAVTTIAGRYDYCFTTGGIGPTHDDITVDAIAAAFGLGVEIHPRARAVLAAYYETRGGLNDGRLRMARVPAGASLIENRISGAPGIRLGNVFILAGVPHIAGQMIDALTGTLEGGKPLLSATLGSWAPESEVADILRHAEKSHDGCQIGSYPFFREGRVGANFVIRSTEAESLDRCAGDLAAQLADAGFETVPGGI